jgi:hypothetical protein
VLWVDKSTIYDLMKKKEHLLKFDVDSEVAKLMDVHKNVNQAMTADLDTMSRE